MRIAYVLPSPELSGGNKVVFHHAAILAGRGHRVTVLAAGPRPAWSPFRGPYVDTSHGAPSLASQDLVVATFWTTLESARRLEAGPLAHFCQGYEGDLVHLRPQRAGIEAVYGLRLPTLTVTAHLGERLRQRFGTESRTAPPALDPLFAQGRWRRRPRRRPWIAVPGIFEAEVKGLRTALEAVLALGAGGCPCRVLRYSLLPLSAAEAAILHPDRYLCAVPPAAVARRLRRCDLLFFPSRPEEGFGLPLLEAMASRVPAVASAIPSTRHMTGGAVPLVPVGDVAAFAAAARRLLEEPRAWRQVADAGELAASRFRAESVAGPLEAALSWARQAGAGGWERPGAAGPLAPQHGMTT